MHSILRSPSSSSHMQKPAVHDLSSLDPELHKNLMYLRDFTGDLEELALDFTVTGADKTVHELIPRGADTPVTQQNKEDYIYGMANFRLNVEIRRHVEAFRRGLFNIIPQGCVGMFDAAELQFLVSGADERIDLDDLRANTVYHAMFDESHPTIQLFWSILGELSQADVQALLKFATSCPRPPLLGFRFLSPKFAIHSTQDETRLPSAATCLNLLRIPPLLDRDQLKERLLYAIRAGAGFELS